MHYTHNTLFSRLVEIVFFFSNIESYYILLRRVVSQEKLSSPLFFIACSASTKSARHSSLHQITAFHRCITSRRYIMSMVHPLDIRFRWCRIWFLASLVTSLSKKCRVKRSWQRKLWCTRWCYWAWWTTLIAWERSEIRREWSVYFWAAGGPRVSWTYRTVLQVRIRSHCERNVFPVVCVHSNVIPFTLTHVNVR